MSDFLTNLFNRHINLTENVQPRIRGRFEPGQNFTAFFLDYTQTNPNNLTSMESAMSEDSDGINTDINNRSRISSTEHNVHEKTTIDNINPKHTGSMQSEVQQPPLKKPHKESSDAVYMDQNSFNKFDIEHEDRPFKEDIEITELRSRSQNNGLTGPVLPQNTKYEELIASQMANTTESKQGMTEPLSGANGVSDIDFGSHGLLGAAPFLFDLKNELNQELKINETKSEVEPTIKVNIGRIEVKAVTQQRPSPLRRNSSPKPKLSLDDYLKNDAGGKR